MPPPQEVDTSKWEKSPKKWMVNADDTKDQTKKYLKFAFDNKELTDIVKEDPGSSKLVDMALMNIRKSVEKRTPRG
ncbi:hypothetical protein [Pseudomonas syringae]|uniref:hypothetical protein n=1 Tax=Pseudomonas syringae TaxID=317 RepID=UPI00147F24AF|nr:hypothetical protein [Pseudomonas syringae]